MEISSRLEDVTFDDLIEWFTERMRKKLHEAVSRGKPNEPLYINDNWSYLFTRVTQEAGEMMEAISLYKDANSVIDEAADTAIFAMFAAHKASYEAGGEPFMADGCNDLVYFMPSNQEDRNVSEVMQLEKLP